MHARKHALHGRARLAQIADVSAGLRTSRPGAAILQARDVTRRVEYEMFQCVNVMDQLGASAAAPLPSASAPWSSAQLRLVTLLNVTRVSMPRHAMPC